MGLFKVFQNPLKSSDPLERIKAIKEIREVNILKKLFITDNDSTVCYEVLKRLSSTKEVYPLLLSVKGSENMKKDISSQINGALQFLKENNLSENFFTENHNKKNLEIYCGLFSNEDKILSLLRLTTFNDKIIEILRNNITSEKGLKELITISTDKKTIQWAIDSLKNLHIDTEDLIKAIVKIKKVKVIRQICSELNDQENLIHIANHVKDSKTYKSAISRIKDEKIIIEIVKNRKRDFPGLKFNNKLDNLVPDFYEYKAKKDCDKCGHPIIINGPILQIHCPTCGNINKNSKSFWKNIFSLSETGGVFISGQRVGLKPGIMKNPRCNKCDSKLPIHLIDVEKIDNDSSITCSKCNQNHTLYKTPGWMKKMRKNQKNPVLVIGGIRENYNPQDEIISSKPVVFNCVSCSSPLEFNVETPRVMECKYCSTSQYLPDALWHAIHPVITHKPWYIMYQ